MEHLTEVSRTPAGRSRWRTVWLRARWLGAWLISCGLAVGCSCERDERKPYTPFGVASSLPAATTAAAAAGETSSPAEFEATLAQRHNPPASSFKLGSETLQAPEGLGFAQTISADFDATDGDELLAWVVPTKSSQRANESGLWFYPSPTTEPTQVVKFPGFVPTDASCQLSVSLRHSGLRSATLRIASDCEPRKPVRVPTEALIVVAPLRPNPELLSLRLAPTQPGETLTVHVDSQDRDGDGHDDVSVRFTLAVDGSENESSAVMAWLERPAGLSRDLEQTAKSFADIGSVEVVRSKGKNTSAHVAQRISDARRLFSYLCAEGGTVGLTTSNGDALPCGDLQLSRNFYAQAEVQAALTQNAPNEALWALARADWYGGAISDKTRRELQEQVRASLTKRKVDQHSINVSARAPSGAPRYSPLSFVTNDTLLILTTDGVKRYRNGELEDATEEVDPWPLVPRGPHGETLTAATLACNEPMISLVGSDPSGRVVQVGTTQTLAPRPGLCGARTNRLEFQPPRLRPILWPAAGLSALVDGLWVGPEANAGARGAPLSANGQQLVARPEAIRDGLLVRHAGKYELWASADASKLSDCVINNDASAIACISGNQVAWLSARE